MKRVIGLTGPIGAGKSTAAALFAKHGFVTLDTDQISRQVVEPGTECLQQLVKAFGAEILTEEGRLDRRRMADVAFSSPADKQILEQITHPAIARAAAEEIAKQPDGAVVVVEAALLPGSPVEPLCDTVVAVVADDGIRLKRVMQRGGLEESAARARMAAQPSCEDYCRLCDHVVINDGDIQKLDATITQLCRRLGVVP